jgi:hypothetical protein
MIDIIPQDLTEKEAAGMTVNERLWVSGLMATYDDAVMNRDVRMMTDILKRIYLDQESIEANIRFAFGEK